MIAQHFPGSHSWASPALIEVLLITAVVGVFYIALLVKAFHWLELYEEWRAELHRQMRRETP